MKIEVTQEDISTGTRRNTECCPLAKAFTRAFGKKTVVACDAFWFVDEDEELLHDCDGECFYDLPLIAINFRHDFDEGFYPGPISFEV